MATHKARGGNRRRGKRAKPKPVKRQRRRADANGCAKRAQRRAPDRRAAGGANGHAVRVNGTAKPRRCAHCRAVRHWLRRSLCWACYADPLIRGKHFDPEHTRLARNPDMRDALDLMAGIDLPAARAAPCPGPLPGWGGSPERLAALARRADAKVELFPAMPRIPLAGVARLFGARDVEGPNEPNHPLPAAAG